MKYDLPNVYCKKLKADILTESNEGYSFAYDRDYLSMLKLKA